jgi:hypothetical protein
MEISETAVISGTARDLLVALQNLCFDMPFVEHNGMMENRWIFRGHASHKWKLAPSAFRGSSCSIAAQVQWESDCFGAFLSHCDTAGLDTAEYSPDVMADVNDGEILKRALRETASFRFGINSWPRPSDLHNLALAQHNGLPTRLLDWTRDPFIAAYFAASEVVKAKAKGEKTGSRTLSIWALDTKILWELYALAKGAAAVRLIFAANSRNRRLFVQRGLFTLVHANYVPKGGVSAITLQKVLESELTSLAENARELAESHPRCKTIRRVLARARREPIIKRFDLPYKEIRVLMRHLAARGIMANTIYADLEGAARATSEQDYWL